MKQRNQHETPLDDEALIVWEKWHNPYLPEDGWEYTKPLTGHDENDFKPKRRRPKKEEEIPPWIGNKVVMTPHGFVPITEYNNPTASFNMWTGHTNFPITNEALDIIARCKGVETLDIITSYRLRIGIATLFKPAEVCENIAKKLNQELSKESPTLFERVQELVDGENSESAT